MSDHGGPLLNWPSLPTKGYTKGDGNNGSPPGGDDLERRVAKLEEAIPRISDRLTHIEADMKHVPTKADLANLESTLIKWVVGTACAMVGLATAIGFGLARLIS